MNSTEFTEESNELLKESIKKDYLYKVWAFSEFRNNRYPEGSHFDAYKYERYLMKIKDREYDGSENTLKLYKEDAEELGF